MENKQRMKQSTSIKVFSSFSIVLGIISIGIQIAALVLTTEGIYNDELDYVGAGIWAGAMYITAGGLGIAASIQHTKSLLVSTVVMAAISLTCSIAAATLSGINAGDGFYYSTHCSYAWKSCEAWLSLEWTLMGFSIGAFINSIVLVSVASVPTCCQKQSKQQPLQSQPYQQVVMVNGQPMVLQPVVAGGPSAMGAQQMAPPQMSVSYPLQLQPQQLVHLAPVAPTPQPSQQPSAPVEVVSGQQQSPATDSSRSTQ